MDFPEHITIKSCTINIRPRYCETDSGGVVHHSVFPIWFEMGRTELLRANSVAYRDLEKAGIFFVVAELKIKYRKPAEYDQILKLTTTCSEVTAAKIRHIYKLTSDSDEKVLAEGSTNLACVDEKGKIRRIPKFMYIEQLKTID